MNIGFIHSPQKEILFKIAYFVTRNFMELFGAVNKIMFQTYNVARTYQKFMQNELLKLSS